MNYRESETTEKNYNDFIIVKNLTKTFRKTKANDNLSFVIKRGEKLGIIGANGAGKTTLVEQLIGVSKPTTGSIKYNFKYNTSPQEKMGMQFQDSSYPEGLSVKDVIDFSLDIFSAEIDKKELQKILKIFQIESFYKKRAKGLSGGQKQKLNVLLALIHKPKIVILDEISTGLDVRVKQEIFNYIGDYIANDDITSILISHNMYEIKKFCERILVLSDGKIIKDLKVQDIIRKYKSLNLFILNLYEKGHIKDFNKKGDMKGVNNE